jgi:hypothetical protein
MDRMDRQRRRRGARSPSTTLSLWPVPMADDEKELFYDGMSNGTLWPLYHDKAVPAEYHRHWWDGYRRINQRYAEAAAKVAGDGATVWVHDYQLQLVPGMLRELRPDLRIGFFLHIPFPPPELFVGLPWRNEIITEHPRRRPGRVPDPGLGRQLPPPGRSGAASPSATPATAALRWAHRPDPGLPHRHRRGPLRPGARTDKRCPITPAT